MAERGVFIERFADLPECPAFDERNSNVVVLPRVIFSIRLIGVTPRRLRSYQL